MRPTFSEILKKKKFPCLILGQDTNPSASAKNLGVVFDSSLNFRKHISQTCRACFYRIRKSLSLDLAKQIAVALVSSKLDYCNSLFYSIPENDIARLQRIKIKTGSRAFSISGPALLYGTPCLCQYVMPKQFYHSGNYLNRTYLIWLSHPSSSAAQLPVDEPALASIITHDHTKDLCASGLGLLRI